jgi:hypothetical protein
MKVSETILISVTVLILVQVAVAQPSGDLPPDNGEPSTDMPHRVFGTVEDTQGNTLTDTKVEVVFDGDTLASDITDEDGYYDITIPYREDYSSEEVQIQVSGSQADSFTYSSGEVEEKDLTVESSQQQDNQEEQTPSGGGGGSGGAGAFPSQNEGTSSNQTETDNNTTSKGNVTNSAQDSDSNSRGSDSENDSTDNNEENQTIDNSVRSFTGMFSGGTSSVGNLIIGFIDAIVSTVASLFE